MRCVNGGKLPDGSKPLGIQQGAIPVTELRIELWQPRGRGERDPMAISPTRDQFKQLATAPDDEPVVMLNLLSVEQTRERLEQANVPCAPVVEERRGRFAAFRDPEGNRGHPGAILGRDLEVALEKIQRGRDASRRPLRPS